MKRTRTTTTEAPPDTTAEQTQLADPPTEADGQQLIEGVAQLPPDPPATRKRRTAQELAEAHVTKLKQDIADAEQGVHAAEAALKAANDAWNEHVARQKALLGL